MTYSSIWPSIGDRPTNQGPHFVHFDDLVCSEARMKPFVGSSSLPVRPTSLRLISQTCQARHFDCFALNQVHSTVPTYDKTPPKALIDIVGLITTHLHHSRHVVEMLVQHLFSIIVKHRTSVRSLIAPLLGHDSCAGCLSYFSFSTLKCCWKSTIQILSYSRRL